MAQALQRGAVWPNLMFIETIQVRPRMLGRTWAFSLRHVGCWSKAINYVVLLLFLMYESHSQLVD